MKSVMSLIVLFAVVAALDLIVADRSFRHRNAKGYSLGYTCLSSFLVTVSYSISLLVEDYRYYSILSSIYFIGIDLTLLSLLAFTWFLVRANGQKTPDLLIRILSLFSVPDILLLALNPFYEITISYIPISHSVAHYAYQMHWPYYLHLVNAYLLVSAVLFYLISKSVSAPNVYRNQYLFCTFTLVFVIFLNALYIFFPRFFGNKNADFSLIGYSLAAVSFYWCCFEYAARGLLSYFHGWIFENMDQALVLFDYEDKMILHNRNAEQMLTNVSFDEDMRLDAFLKYCGIKAGHETDGTHYSFQCFVGGNPMRCDYSVEQDKKNRRLGRLFVFSSVATQYDLLTGFRSWTDFKENAESMFPLSDETTVVATCDINSLSAINLKRGRNAGDLAIQRLAEEMRKAFPYGTFFTRSREAAIAAICVDADMETVERCVENLQTSLAQITDPETSFQIQTAVSIRGEESIVETIRRNLQSMKTKKLMDRTSVHSEMLLSLLQALTQCDPDTGAHVQRTQQAGAELGRRIGLNDQEQSNLALLAILHDIGKIGIPLEILNKPGKLSDAEWNMLKTHTEKGSQIAKSSKELRGIADMILYHHERWDGRGYPAGLKEEQIPLLSRIISVVDAYDAMTNDRSYRKALSVSAARSELIRCSGTQFDPHIVQEYIAMLEEHDRKMGITHSTMSEQESIGRTEYRVSAAVPERKERRNVHIMAYSMYVLNNQNQRIVEVDDRFERITGYSKQDIRDNVLTQMDLIFTEDRDEYGALVVAERTKAGDIYLEHRLRRKDGKGIFVYCYGHEFYDSAVGEERTRIVIIDSAEPFQI